MKKGILEAREGGASGGPVTNNDPVNKMDPSGNEDIDASALYATYAVRFREMRSFQRGIRQAQSLVSSRGDVATRASNYAALVSSLPVFATAGMGSSIILSAEFSGGMTLVNGGSPREVLVSSLVGATFAGKGLLVSESRVAKFTNGLMGGLWSAALTDAADGDLSLSAGELSSSMGAGALDSDLKLPVFGVLFNLPATEQSQAAPSQQQEAELQISTCKGTRAGNTDTNSIC